MNSTTLFIALFFGCVGMGYFVYGKKQARGVALLAGVGLCMFPYLITNAYLMLLVGAVLMALPFVIKH